MWLYSSRILSILFYHCLNVPVKPYKLNYSSCSKQFLIIIKISFHGDQADLGVGSNGSFALFARIGKERLVALYAERFLISQYVSVTHKVEVAVEAGEDVGALHTEWLSRGTDRGSEDISKLFTISSC